MLPDGTAGPDPAESAGRSEPYERGADSGDALGWAAAGLGFQAVTPIFDGASEQDIQSALKTAGLPESGKVQLFDGRTGEPFEQLSTVGYIYMLKLHHLVDDKVHARSTGPVLADHTAAAGRQGEVRRSAVRGNGSVGVGSLWGGLHPPGVAHGEERRRGGPAQKIYESMVKGENTLEAGTPASFDVLTNEIRGLALNMQLEKAHI